MDKLQISCAVLLVFFYCSLAMPFGRKKHVHIKIYVPQFIHKVHYEKIIFKHNKKHSDHKDESGSNNDLGNQGTFGVVPEESEHTSGLRSYRTGEHGGSHENSGSQGSNGSQWGNHGRSQGGGSLGSPS